LIFFITRPENIPRRTLTAAIGHGVRKKQPTTATNPISHTIPSTLEGNLLVNSKMTSPRTSADTRGKADRSPPTITVTVPALLKIPNAV
jgi:hypothetical protein